MKNAVKLVKFFDRELPHCADELIVPLEKNTYLLFNKYRVIQEQDKVVAYDMNYKESVDFSSLKVAVSYCTLMHNKKYNQAKRLKTIDLKLISLTFDASIHKQRLKQSIDEDSKILYTTKIQEDFYQKRLLRDEMDYFINSSKDMLSRKLSHNFN
jgi:hypothetical protein